MKMIYPDYSTSHKDGGYLAENERENYGPTFPALTLQFS